MWRFFTIFKLGMCLNRSLKIKGFFYIYIFFTLLLNFDKCFCVSRTPIDRGRGRGGGGVAVHKLGRSQDIKDIRMDVK